MIILVIDAIILFAKKMVHFIVWVKIIRVLTKRIAVMIFIVIVVIDGLFKLISNSKI